MVKDFTNLASYFDNRAKRSTNACYVNGYSAECNESNNLYDEVTSEIVQLVRVSNVKTALEIGCGTGEISRRLSNYIPHIQGVDISKKMIALAREQGLDVKHYDGRHLPFSDHSFDIVLIYQVLTNIHSLLIVKQILKEATRVLGDKGQLFLGAIPHPESSGFPVHTLWSAKSIYSRFRSWFGGSNSIGYFSFQPTWFFCNSDKLSYDKFHYFKCSIDRSGWRSKYHILMEKK